MKNQSSLTAFGKAYRVAAWSVVLAVVSGTPHCSWVHVTNLFPANGAVNVCPDTPLRITFKTAPALQGKGLVNIFDSTGEVVDSIDLSVAKQTKAIGGLEYNYDAFTLDGNVLTLHPHVRLAYGKSYRVSVEPGFLPHLATLAQLQRAGLGAWRFSTKAAAPAPGSAHLTVAADGSGDFCTLQGAIDFVPSHNRKPVLITLRPGLYDDLVRVLQRKDHLTVQGADRATTILAARNNAKLNPDHRDLMFVGSNDFTLENVTVHNTTPKGGSQAEALRVKGERCILNHDNFISFQDTLRLDGQVYVHECYIEGDVDAIWGAGTTYLDHCELKAVNKGYLVQERDDSTRWGIIFADCKIETIPGVAAYIGRIQPKRFPYSSVAYLNCAMDKGVVPAGWLVEGEGSTENLRFWEYQSTDLASGKPLDVSQRLAGSRQITADEAKQLRDIGSVMNGWIPVVAGH